MQSPIFCTTCVEVLDGERGGEANQSHPVCIFGVDIILDCHVTLLSKVIGGNLHEVGDLGLSIARVSCCGSPLRDAVVGDMVLTKMNISASSCAVSSLDR
jgi:hypothetical protein